MRIISFILFVCLFGSLYAQNPVNVEKQTNILNYLNNNGVPYTNNGQSTVEGGLDSLFNRPVGIDTLSTLADTATANTGIGQLVYVNSVDQYWHVQSDGFFYQLETGGGGAITEPQYVAHDTALTFLRSKYYQAFTVNTDTLTYTVDTTGGVLGAYTVARVNFGETGRPVIFSGSVFDTVQTYSVASGDSLTGVHIFYFENTPYGVAVSVPTNNRTSVDTIQGGNEPAADPALAKTGGLALYTGLQELTQVNDTLVQWIDQINNDTARNVIASREPAITGLGVNFQNNQCLQMVNGFQFQDSIAITAAFQVTAIPVSDNAILGQSTDAASWDITYKRFDGGFTAFRDANVTTPADTIAQNDMVVLQVSCISGSCQFWKNGVSIGSDTFTETLPQTYDVLGAYVETGASSLKGTLYYFSAHRATYTTPEVASFFNYVNTAFSLGL